METTWHSPQSVTPSRAVSKPIPPYLKLLAADPRETGTTVPRGYAGVEGLHTSFAVATGWTLRNAETLPKSSSQFDPWTAPVYSGVGVAPGPHVVELGDLVKPDARPRIGKQAAGDLATEIGRLLNEVRTLQKALWEREADLAAGVPVIAHRDEDEHLATRLHSVLKAGAEAVGCNSAALYLLDDATSELKMRAAFGLPLQCLLSPARPLRGSLADLEALLGHAVVLDSPEMFNAWAAPDDITYGAAVCVPVSSPTIPLGTLWMFSAQPRDFTDRETNLVEIVAGRLASDLERTMLVQSGAAQSREARAREERALPEFGTSQNKSAPRTPPMIPGWEIGGDANAGGTGGESARNSGGAFVDWWTRRDGVQFFCVAKAMSSSAEGRLIATTVQTALRAHSDYLDDPAEILQRVNQSLWSGSAGDQTAAAWLGMLDGQSDELRFATAGEITMVVFGGETTLPKVTSGLDLGLDPDAEFHTATVRPVSGESLIIRTGHATISNLSFDQKTASDLARASIQPTADDDLSDNQAVLVLRKRDKCFQRNV